MVCKQCKTECKDTYCADCTRRLTVLCIIDEYNKTHKNNCMTCNKELEGESILCNECYDDLGAVQREM